MDSAKLQFENLLVEMPFVIPAHRLLGADILKLLKAKIGSISQHDTFSKESLVIYSNVGKISGTGMFLLLKNGKTLVAATDMHHFSTEYAEGLDVVYPKKTGKFEGTYNNSMLALYSHISSRYRVYIMTDEHHSEDAKNVWMKWASNPNKYKIKDIRFYNTRTNKFFTPSKIESVWGSNESHKNMRVIAKW